jgi:hypothetical protein
VEQELATMLQQLLRDDEQMLQQMTR